MTFPAAPYPANTKTKGWVFEMDVDRMQQSDTWALAPAEVRPWLLMMWVTAWGLTPSGSLPGDEAVLCARIGMAPKVFAKHRALLLRGWTRADDGRLYHETITELVLQMLQRRKSEAERKAEYRAKKDSERRALDTFDDPEMSHGTTKGLPPDSTRNPTLTTDQLPNTNTENSVCDLPTHTLPDSFKAEIQKARPDLNPDIVWEVFTHKTKPKDQTLAVWRSWIARERPPVQVAASALSDPDTRANVEAEGVAKGLGAWQEGKEQWASYKAKVRGDKLPGLTVAHLAQRRTA